MQITAWDCAYWTSGPQAPWWLIPILVLVFFSPLILNWAENVYLASVCLPSQTIPAMHVAAVYSYETAVRPYDAAVGVAKEQSAYVFGGGSAARNRDLYERHAAKVLHVGIDEIRYFPGLPRYTTAAPVFDRRYNGWPCQRGQFTLAFPEANFDGDVVQLLNSLIGEPHHSAWVSRIKLLDIQATDAYLARSFTGPRFGVSGIRNLLDVRNRPLFCGPVKPSVGCAPAEFAKQAYRAWIGGVDIVKDDELLGNPAYCPLAKRLPLVIQARNRAQDETGERKLFVAHVSGQDIERNAELAVRHGADGLMVCPFLVGWQWLPKLTAYGRPVFSHNAGLTTTSREPDFGVDFPLWCKLSRWLGADVVIMPSPAGSFVMSPRECKEATKRCLKDGLFRPSFPAYAGSKTAAHLPMFTEMVRSTDYMMIVGAALFEHPLGVEAGARALRQGWDSLALNADMVEYAHAHPELHQALAQIGLHVWHLHDFETA
ncbi:MAG: hypothetical protein HY420_00015 [Candidatus Kerfeldbacteria bacterium]|nr:hypothetical protein [Candidatus Kerfeldbacteria bacterium]